MNWYEVGYQDENIFSVNLLHGFEEDCREYAEEHAEKFGYTVAYMKPATKEMVMDARRKGMPITYCSLKQFP